MALLTLTRGKPFAITEEREFMEHICEELTRIKAVRVQGESVVFDPRYMSLDRFYLIELNNEPYLYRKVNEDEVEIYGLAEQT